MTKILIYQGYGYLGFRFRKLGISGTTSPPNARLVHSYDNLLLYEHRYLAQLQVFASGEHFLSASVKFFVQNRLAVEANLLTVAEVRGGAPGPGREGYCGVGGQGDFPRKLENFVSMARRF